ncbi:MAG: hypothetical protein ACLP3K_13715 [Candidatus Acidiferrales bacterium]
MRSVKALAALYVVIVLASPPKAQQQPVSSASPINAEQIAVYRGFLEKFSSFLHFRNLSNVTVTFDFKGFPEGRPCLRGIELENDSEPFRTTHALPQEITKGMDIRLVDTVQKRELLQQRDALSKDQNKPALDDQRAHSNVLVLSEIVFDTKHQFALVKYLLLCGQQCLSGDTLVMEKAHDEWIVSSRRPCAMFVGVWQHP